MPDTLQALPEDWHSALAVVAHPDDLEYGAAAAVARWVGQGKRVAYCLVTSGEAGIDAIAPDVARPVREREQRASAAVVGVDEVEFLGFPDGILEYGLALRQALAHAVRRHRPDVVVTNNHRETWDTGEVNHADHVATGHALVDAVRDAANRWVFPDGALAPWDGVRALLSAHSPHATHGVDVAATIETAVRSLLAHEAYLAGLGAPGRDAARELRDAATATGPRVGATHAVAFEVLSF